MKHQEYISTQWTVITFIEWLYSFLRLLMKCKHCGATKYWPRHGSDHHLITANQFDLGPLAKCLPSRLHVGGHWATSLFTSYVHLNLLSDRIGTDSADFARVQSWSGSCWNNFFNVYTKFYKWNKFKKLFRRHGKLITYSVFREH